MVASGIGGRALALAKRSRRLLTRPRSQRPVVIFVAGVHRSGTNMVLDVLDASMRTDVFGESDSRAFDNYVMRDVAVIERLVARSRADTVVVKALHEAHKLRELMDRFAPAKAIWPVRRFHDVVNSIVRRWPDYANDIDEIAADRRAGGWRSRGMTDETYRILRRHYRTGMDAASANALFWYYRNQLFFDQGLAADGRVLPIAYEALVHEPEACLSSLAAFAGISPTARMRRIPHGRSVGKDAPPTLLPDVHALCSDMERNLYDACRLRSPGVLLLSIPHRHGVQHRAPA